MSGNDARTTLERLIRDNGDDFSTVSRMLGKNPAYIQQFIRRGTPRKLDEADRRRLAEYYRVDERLLGGPDSGMAVAPKMVAVRQLDVDASAGGGALAEEDGVLGSVHFPERWLRSHGVDPARLSLVRVLGDSMEPTLSDGDQIMVDHGGVAGMLRDGIHVIRMQGTLMVKRIAVAPSGLLSIISDNRQYRTFEDVSPDMVEIVGRVIWAGRFL